MAVHRTAPHQNLLHWRRKPVPHSPETTGPQAFARFTDELLGNSAAARTLRASHALMIVPLVNPDSFVMGHWRHNVGGKHLNRDWGPFTQPETRAAVDRNIQSLRRRPRTLDVLVPLQDK